MKANKPELVTCLSPALLNLYDVDKRFNSIPVLCRDNDKSTNLRAYITSFRFNNRFNKDIYFDLFKKFIKYELNDDQISEKIIIKDLYV